MCEELKRNGGAIKFESVFQSVFYTIQYVQFSCCFMVIHLIFVCLILECFYYLIFTCQFTGFDFSQFQYFLYCFVVPLKLNSRFALNMSNLLLFIGNWNQTRCAGQCNLLARYWNENKNIVKNWGNLRGQQVRSNGICLSEGSLNETSLKWNKPKMK